MRLALEPLEPRDLLACVAAPMDLTGDGWLTPADVAIVVNDLNSDEPSGYTPLDALIRINELNAGGSVPVCDSCVPVAWDLHAPVPRQPGTQPQVIAELSSRLPAGMERPAEVTLRVLTADGVDAAIADLSLVSLGGVDAGDPIIDGGRYTFSPIVSGSQVWQVSASVLESVDVEIDVQIEWEPC